jgi:hypothetical protein
MTKKETIFVTVKTYPNTSSKYSELVCTAGLREDGSWIRIYPVPFRLLSDDKQFHKYTYIRVPIRKNTSDSRPESYKIANSEEIEILAHVDTANNWERRKDHIFKSKIYTSMAEIIHKANKERTLSLATFKPSKILGFYAEKNKSETLTKQEALKFTNANKSLFSFVSLKNMPKVGYSFKIEFEDDTGKVSKMTILDWEFLQLYVNCRYSKKLSQKESKEKVLQRLQFFKDSKDLYFFLGTTSRFDGWATNPFTIIGIFYPPTTSRLHTPSLF